MSRHWAVWIPRTVLAVRKLESREKWLRIGVRTYALLIVGFTLLVLGAALESTVTGDVSLITRLAWFTYLLCAIPAVLFGTICLAIGLIRRYVLKRGLENPARSFHEKAG